MFFEGKENQKLLEYLEDEKKSYPQIFESSPDILLFIVDLQGIIIKMRGVNDDDERKRLIGNKFIDFIYDNDKDKVTGYFKEAFSGSMKYVEYRTIGFNGEVIHNDVTLVPIHTESNEVIGVYGLAHNHTEKIELQRGIKETKERLHSLLFYSHEIITILDADGTISYQSPSIEKALGYEPDEVIGKNAFGLVHPDDHELVKGKYQLILKQPNTPYTFEVRLRRSNGDWRNYEVICTNQLNNPSINGVICNLHDITELIKKQNEIKFMANHDYLTSLPNRRAFEEKLGLEIRQANLDESNFAVFILNLNGFKFLNDSIGHDSGDHLLIEIARKLTNKLENKIEMLARIGGDEFAILTTSVQNTEEIEQIAKEVLQVFEHPFDIKEYNLFVTSSIGISIFPESGEDISSLIINADLALHLAEKYGNNTFKIFSPTADVGTYKLFSLRNDLGQALFDEEFLIYFQPIYHVGTNQIESVEALLRWEHKDWGIISPNEFIPLAEESGKIHELGKWVLRTVCKNLREWHDAGYFIKASVNLSIVQFLQKGLIDMIQTTLQENELDPKWLTIEITESVMIEQEVKVLKKVKKIREMGIEISLDDFGTGYASFKKIMDLKPDILKLDKSLTDGIASEKESYEITAAIIKLAHNLSIRVVAEGVETIEQLDILKSLDCNWIQGYLYSRPVPKEDLELLLKGQMVSEFEPRPTKGRRKSFRVDCQCPLEANMTVSKWKGERVALGNTKVLIENIGPDGLCFLSNVKLPANSDIILKFHINILGEELELNGKIVYDAEQANYYRYGIQFLECEQKREYLINHLNQFQLLLNENPFPQNHSFVMENLNTYFAGM